jgi:hypothetical protein
MNAIFNYDKVRRALILITAVTPTHIFFEIFKTNKSKLSLPSRIICSLQCAHLVGSLSVPMRSSSL